MRTTIGMLAILLLTSTPTLCETITYNNGGVVRDFEQHAREIRAKKGFLKIDGFCGSSCMTMAAQARPYVCITSNATFAYHKTTWGRNLPLSKDINAWIVHHGGFPPNSTMRTLPNDVAHKFWPSCQS